MKAFRLTLLVCLSLAAVHFPLPAQVPDTPALTLEWIASPAAKDSMGTPACQWLADGTLLLLDSRRPEPKRALESLEPETGRRSVLLAGSTLKERIQALIPGKTIGWPKGLPWPDDIANDGCRLAYLVEGDLFLVHIPGGGVEVLTQTEAEEKCPVFSPDGKKIAFVREGNLYVRDLETGREKALTHDGGETRLNGTLSWIYWEEIYSRQDTAYWWSPDSKAIAFYQFDDSKVEVSSFMEYEPATPRVVHQRYPKAGGRNPAVKVGIVELASGKLVWVDLGRPAPEYVVRLNWVPDSARLSLQTLNRKQNRLELLLADRKTGRCGTVLTEENQTSQNVQDDLQFLDGGRKFIWSSERDGYNHLYLYGIDGQLIRRLTAGKWAVRAARGPIGKSGSVCWVDEKGGWVYFTAAMGSPIDSGLYRASLDGGLPQPISREPGTHQVVFNPAGTVYLDRYSNPSVPWGLKLHRADGGELLTVAPPSVEVLAQLKIRTPELTSVPAADGFPLPASLLKPETLEPGRRYPVIVYVYGGPSAPVVQNQWDRFTLYDNLLLANGFICFSIDNRSATGLSKTLEDTAYRQLMGKNQIEDILAGVRWLKDQPFVDPDRIGVWGWSGGGTTTLQLMTHAKDFRAGIAVAAVTDFRYYDSRWTEAVLERPEENPQGFRESAPANFAADLSGHLLLVHGTSDDNVHPQNVWRFAREAIKAGKLFEMMIYPLGDHGISNANRHVWQTMLDFWLRRLK